MLKSLEHLDKYKIAENPLTLSIILMNTLGTYIGSFIMGTKFTNEKFKVVASIDCDEWEHISLGASHENGRLPKIKEIEYIKNLFWGEEEAEQIIMETSREVCWHLWRNKYNPQVAPPAFEDSQFVWLEQLIRENNKQQAKK